MGKIIAICNQKGGTGKTTVVTERIKHLILSLGFETNYAVN